MITRKELELFPPPISLSPPLKKKRQPSQRQSSSPHFTLLDLTPNRHPSLHLLHSSWRSTVTKSFYLSGLKSYPAKKVSESGPRTIDQGLALKCHNQVPIRPKELHTNHPKHFTLLLPPNHILDTTICLLRPSIRPRGPAPVLAGLLHLRGKDVHPPLQSRASPQSHHWKN